MPVTRLLVLTLACLAVCVPSAGATTTAMRPAGPVVDGLDPLRAPSIVGDGEHAIAFQPTRETVRVVRTNGETINIAAPAGCLLAAVRVATVLWGCPVPHPPSGERWTPLLQDATTGISTPPPGLDASPIVGTLDFPSSVLPTGLGLRFIGVSVHLDARDGTSTSLVARDDARSVRRASRSATRVPDLDRATGDRPLCAGLARVSQYEDGFGAADGFLPYVYSRPWGLTLDASYRWTLQRCGQRKARRIACGPCQGLMLSNGRLAWFDFERQVYVRDLRRGRERRFRVPASAGVISALALTADAVYVVVGPYGKPASVFRASLG